jgi:hypothetical protein
VTPAGGEIKLQISEAVGKLMEERHIYEDDMKQVIESAEGTGSKLYDTETGKFLAKRRIADVTFYAIYSSSPEGYMIYDAYSHRSEIEGG